MESYQDVKREGVEGSYLAYQLYLRSVMFTREPTSRLLPLAHYYKESSTSESAPAGEGR